MGRPQAFNFDHVVRVSTDLFSNQGYHSTSIEKLLEVTNISRSSFYHTFVNKEGLYMKSLELKASEGEHVYKQISQHSTVKERLRLFLRFQKYEESYQSGIGCLLVNTVVELSNSEPGLVKQALSYLERTEMLLTLNIKAGQEKGEIKSKVAPEILARFFMGVKKGLLVSVRHGCEIDDLDDVIDTALLLLNEY